MSETLLLSWNIGTLEQNRVFLNRIKHLSCSKHFSILEQTLHTPWNKIFKKSLTGQISSCSLATQGRSKKNRPHANWGGVDQTIL